MPATVKVDAADLMQQDCRLADALALPTAPPAAEPRCVLLTGATGFLGRYAARALLADDRLRLICPVRADSDAAAQARVANALQQAGVPPEVVAARVEALQADITRPRLGLSAEVFAALAARVDRIYHTAALVNWGRSYRQLRQTNVLGVLELLRLALLERAKPLVFVSSIAVCYAGDAPAQIDEHTDMAPHAATMPLGYAQSKAVAEALLRSAARRGLPVAILRPALIAGDTTSGHGNTDDLLAALIEGAVASGAAPDLDWLMDCVPVDFVAATLARLPLDKPGLQTVHLVHDRPRHWREFILWLNFDGHPVQLLPTEQWLGKAFDQGGVRDTRLHGYRRFFQGRAATPGARPFERYLAPAQRRIAQAQSAALLAQLGLAIPPLDVPLLHRYLDYYRSRSLVPPSPHGPRPTAGTAPKWLQLLSRTIAAAATPLHVRSLPFQSGNGILNEIAAARLGAEVGLRRYEVAGSRSHGPLDLIVKAKPADTAMIALTTELAALCDPDLGQAFGRFGNELGLAASHERELAIYELLEPRLQRFLPQCHGTHRDPARGVWTVALEFVAAAPTADITGSLEHWTSAAIGCAVRDLAAIHAIWLGRNEALAGAFWLPPRLDLRQLRRHQPLWIALQRFATPWFRQWAGNALLARHQAVISQPDRWLAPLFDLPQTLIHNDFNPRNCTLRATDHGPQLCVFDWELATLGLPQHDLAEFLCFVADPGQPPAAAFAPWVERHRAALAAAAACNIDAAGWLQGLAAALDHLLAERLPMYVLIHRFRPQGYLPRVLRNWLRLREWVDQALQPDRLRNAETVLDTPA